MNATWRKDKEVLSDAQVQNYARYQDQQLIYTSMLHLLNVNFTDEGRYQCVISNNFSSNYSAEAKVTVNGTLSREASQRHAEPLMGDCALNCSLGFATRFHI